MKIEIHLLQNFVPSCLNRDDTNTPKDCEFGGVRRARISSQCFKRAVREHFQAKNSASVGSRTKALKTEILRHLDGKTSLNGEALEANVISFIETYYSKMDAKEKKKDDTAVLLFLSSAEIEEASRCVIDLIDAGGIKMDKEVDERLSSASLSADIALFGRMLAENPKKSIDAACQVAHALSTHEVDLEMDFYSAVDDLQPKGDTGAGMLGVTGYNSACFYRYALVDLEQLTCNLGGDRDLAERVLEAFLYASVFAIPTGKQNSMAAQNVPSFGMTVVRSNGAPISLANAFARPVRVPKMDTDLVGLSVEALSSYWQQVTKVYGKDGVRSVSLFHLTDPGRITGLESADAGTVKNMVEQTMAAIRGQSAGATAG